MRTLLEQLISFPRVSREEKAAADFLEEWLRSRGLSPHRKGNNLWCLKGSGPAILLDAHIDTVKPAPSWTGDPFSPVFQDGKITGLGSNDDGGPLVALLHAFMAFEPRKHTFVLSLSAEEEVSGSGGLSAALSEMEAEAGPFCCGIIAEPTGLRMAVTERGLMVLDCTATGVAGHAARNTGVNAIYEALPDIEWFRREGMQVTQMAAGQQHNLIPDRCTFVVDVRTTGPNLPVLERIREHVRCTVEPRSTRLGGSAIGADHPLVQAGKAIGLETFDSPTLSNQALCPFPTVKLGPGESERSHTAGEYILLQELEEGRKTYLKLLQAYENLG